MQKCPACDGYATRPSRKTPGRFVKCRACKGAGVLLTIADWMPPVQTMPTPPLVPAIGQPVPFTPTHPGDPVVIVRPYGVDWFGSDGSFFGWQS